MSRRDPWALQRSAIAAGRQYELAPTARLVLLILTRYADGEGECHPGLGRLAGDAGIGERQVARALASLVEAGLVVRSRRGPGRPAATRLILPDLTSPSAHDKTPVSAQGVPDLTPASPKTRHERHPRPAIGVRSIENRPGEQPDELPPFPRGGRQRDLAAFLDECQLFAEAHFPDLATQPYLGDGGKTRGAAAVSQAIRVGANTPAEVVALVERTWRRAA